LIWPLLAFIWTAAIYPIYQAINAVHDIQERQVQMQQVDSISLEQRNYLINIVGKLTTIECFSMPQVDRVKYGMRKDCADVPLPNAVNGGGN
jgi:hypothetical protein